MSRHVEYISPAGLRTDGRRPREHRRVNIALGVTPNCDGSCCFTSGGTKVVAHVFGPRELGHKADARDQCVITCDVAVTAFAGERRKMAQRKTKQANDLSAAVLDVAQSLVLVGQYPASQIQIYVEVLQHDGSEKAAVINAACLALADASVAMRDVVVALSVGVLDTQVVCDITAAELKSQCPMLTVALRGHKLSSIVWCEMESRVAEPTMDAMFEAAEECAKQIFDLKFRGALQAHAKEAQAVQQEKLCR